MRGGNSTNPIQTTPDGSNVGDEKEGTVSGQRKSIKTNEGH